MQLKLTCTVLALLAVGCGAAGSEPATGDDQQAAEATGATDNGAGEPAPINPTDALAGFSPVGRWENSSCGDRQFLRRINFTDDGKFVAVDEVAPCPPKVVCVWSGIVHWRGSWKLEERLIRLTLEPIQNQKQPEVAPDAFVVLGADPPSIGEQAGELTCPYQLVD
jgi:hypothetical protein